MARQVHGAWFRASKDAWYATVDGKSVSLGIKGKANRRAAQTAWHRLIAEGPKVKPEAIPEALTVQGVVDAFLIDGKARLKPATVRIYGYDLGTLCKVYGTLPSTTLTAQHLSRWLHGLGVGTTTQAIMLRSASACFGWAVRAELLPVNPACRVPKPKTKSRSEEAVIGDVDHAKLLASATPEFALVLRVLHATGARPGEVCRITTDTFDAENAVVKLWEHKTDKTGKPRLVFLSPETVALLKAQAERYGSGPLLRSRRGKPYSPKAITKAMQYLQKKVGVKSIAYGYRHGFATQALANGVPDAHVAALLGHSSTAMLHRHYSHLGSRADVLRESLGKVR